MNARDGIIARIRASNRRVGPVSHEQSAANAARIAAHEPNLIPARAEGDAKTLADRFVAFAEEVAATVDRVASADQVPAAVANFLAKHNLPTELVASPDTALDAYPWAKSLLRLERRGAKPDDVVSLTPTVLGVAETG
jgi:L-lactate dehydrogenase complex protein LldG